jgi:DNA topoisomerase
MPKYNLGILCEKPSQARNFAKALGGMSGNFNNTSYIIVPARGHLYEFKDPEKQVSGSLASSYKSWDLKNLPWNEKDFSWEREPKEDTSQTLKTIKDTLIDCAEWAIATDDDPTGEGEMIAWEIFDALPFKPQKYSRFYFDDESEKSIQKAFINRKPIKSMMSDMDYIKADYRSKWDFLSMQWTRIASKNGNGVAVLRQGRLKSAMILIVGTQLEAIKNYKAVPFYQNRFRDENNIVYTNPEEPMYPDKNQVPQTYTDSAVIVDSRTMKSTAPKKLLDLASLSALLAPMGYTAKSVLETYQKMYEAQIVSYPRTEDKCITPEQFNDLLPHIDKIAGVVGVDVSLLTHRTPRSTHVKTGMAHGANRPGLNVPKDLASLTQYGTSGPEIYKILAKNYLAMLAEDYEYEAWKGHLEKYPEFSGTASVPKKMGWKLVFSDTDDTLEDDSDKGLGTMASPFIHEGFPPKPVAPTMKWLMKQLEKHDVGTGATRTSTYADVTSTKTKYPLLIEKKGKLSMSEFGEMSYLLLPNTHIGNLDITVQLMSDMKAIAKGEANPDELLAKVKQLIIDDLDTMSKNGELMRQKLGITIQKPVQTNPDDYYTCTWKSKPVKFKRVWSGYRFSDDECARLANGEEIEITAVSSNTGNPFTCKGKLEVQTYQGRKFLGFKMQNDFPDKWCEHVFTDEEKDKLLAGKSINIVGAISKNGNKFNCSLKYKNGKFEPTFNKK